MATTYLSPGVYVEEVPSAVQPIAGVGTSTAGFIGVFKAPVAVSSRTVTERLTGVDGAKTTFPLQNYPVEQAIGASVHEGGQTLGGGWHLQNDDQARSSSIVFDAAPAKDTPVTVTYQRLTAWAAPGEVKLITNFGEFSTYFGGFSTDPGLSMLAHAVYGFFNNGGTRCYVVRQEGIGDIATSALVKFQAIDEIAIVAAPGITDSGVRAAITVHCRVDTQDRFAIFDGDRDTQDGAGNFDASKLNPPSDTDYGAFYVPWLQVFDPATGGPMYVPPSGHIAGVYARVDTERGVHKAPANEVILGATGLRYLISKNQQDGLNSTGINAIRNLNGAIRVWGARTVGGDRNGEWRYINVRRLFLFLRKSIDQGTQWVVFEPNDPGLWAKITRNITAFLTNVWRSGALFGTTPAEAFYVKCDAETNPPSVRDAGQVVTEIGVAVVKPAEFVIFHISQWAGPGK